MVERDLCAGGMSLIYLAQDRSSGRRVVVKVLRPDLALLLGPERFQREIRVTERLHHPNIVPLEHSGDADGLLYYVMPLIEGESLRARLKESGPLAVEETIRTGSEVAEALNHAHAEGFVHRDLKPDNILFARHGAMLADFGLARLRTAGSSDLSSEGIAIGTPEYMSPEQGAANRPRTARDGIPSADRCGAARRPVAARLRARRRAGEASQAASVYGQGLRPAARGVARAKRVGWLRDRPQPSPPVSYRPVPTPLGLPTLRITTARPTPATASTA
jgi:serine/threonine protein kinase